MIKQMISLLLYPFYMLQNSQLLLKIKKSARSYYWRKKFKFCDDGVWFDGISQIIGASSITIGSNTCFGSGLFLTYWGGGGISIGADCHFGAYNHLSSSNQIIVEDGVLTGKWVTIVDNNHGETDRVSLRMPPLSRTIVSKGPVVIKKNVWLGDKVTVLPGVTIGEGAVVAANSVVTRNVPPFCVVAGIPAKVIKQV